APKLQPSRAEPPKGKPTRTRARSTSLTMLWSRPYSRVVCVTRLSSVTGILSVPKNASRALTTAVLWQAGAAGDSGKFGGVARGAPLGRGVLGEGRGPAERGPARVGRRLRVTVGVRQRNRLVGPPEPVVVLGVEAGDHPIAPGHVGHRQHPRR